MAVYYLINGRRVSAPDEEQWEQIEIGTGLNGEPVRSPYWNLTWHKTVGVCLDWMEFNGQRLASLTTRPPDSMTEVRTFTDAVCVFVGHRKRLGVGTDFEARFVVYVPD